MITWNWLESHLRRARTNSVYLSVREHPDYVDGGPVPLDTVIFAEFTRNRVATSLESLAAVDVARQARQQLQAAGVSMHIHDDYEDGLDIILSISTP